MRTVTEFLSGKGIKSNKDVINVPLSKIWLEEYAKETSIEFFKWNDQYLIDIDPNNQGTVLKMQFYQMSIEERYNLFIKSIEDAKEKV